MLSFVWTNICISPDYGKQYIHMRCNGDEFLKTISFAKKLNVCQLQIAELQRDGFLGPLKPILYGNKEDPKSQSSDQNIKK